MTEPTTSELMRIVQQMAEDSKEHRQELKATIAGMTANFVGSTAGTVKWLYYLQSTSTTLRRIMLF